MTNPVAAPKQRHLFIDLYRSAVIFLMLEGHVFRTFLPLETQQSPLFQFHEFFHGLTAPAFLFGAGLTFVISTKKHWEEYHHWGAPLARRIRRYLVVIALGLALDLPWFSLRKIILEGTAQDYFNLFRFNVLQCIGIGLLSLHALVFFFRKESRFYGLVLATIVTVCFITPLLWDVDFQRYLPIPLAQAVNGNYGSPFPLFPFVGFLFAGVIVSWEYLVAVREGRERRFMAWVSALGGIFVASGILFDLLPLQIYPRYNYWFTSPNYFLVRTGALMMMTSGSWHLAGWIRKPRNLLTVLGRESLFVYVLHLLIIYGSVVNPQLNLQVALGMTLSVVQASGLFIALLVAMLLAALAWSHLKEKHFNAYRLIQLGGGGGFLYYLLTRDF